MIAIQNLHFNSRFNTVYQADHLTRKKNQPEKQVSPFVFKQCVAVLQHHDLLGKFAGTVQGLHEVDAFFVGAQVDFAL